MWSMWKSEKDLTKQYFLKAKVNRDDPCVRWMLWIKLVYTDHVSTVCYILDPIS